MPPPSLAVAAANLSPPATTATVAPRAAVAVGDIVAQFSPVNRAEQVTTPAVVPAPPPVSSTAVAPTGHEASLIGPATAADAPPVCTASSAGPPCPPADRTGDAQLSAPISGITAGGTQLAGPSAPRASAALNGLAAGLSEFRDEVATVSIAFAQDVRDVIASLPQTGMAQWLRHDPVAALPLTLGSLLMLLGLVVRRRGMSRSLRVRISS